MPIANRQKAVIHVAKGQLHMADEDYRAMLQRAAGVSSSSALDDAGFERVMAEFERLGFRNARQRGQNVRREGFATPKQLGRMRALWKEYSGNDDELALGKWLEKKFQVSSIRFVKDADAGKVVAVLKGMAAWRRAKRAREAAASVGPKA
jgi:hypothetical protein